MSKNVVIQSTKILREVGAMDMSIAAMSVDMHQMQTMRDVGIAALKMSREAESTMIEEAIELGDVGSLDPALGNNIDISV